MNGGVKLSKLYFFQGPMGATKSAQLITTKYNYAEKNMFPLLFTSSIDTRNGRVFHSETVNMDIALISSRIRPLSAYAFVVGPEDNVYEMYKKITCYIKKKPHVVLVDEVSFFKREQIDQLSDIVDFEDIPVLTYGLRADFKTEAFEGSLRLFEIADEIHEIKSMCHCGRKATVNARVVDGKIVREGEKILVGGNETYESLCRKCYKLGKNIDKNK